MSLGLIILRKVALLASLKWNHIKSERKPLQLTLLNFHGQCTFSRMVISDT